MKKGFVFDLDGVIMERISCGDRDRDRFEVQRVVKRHQPHGLFRANLNPRQQK